MDEKAFKNIVQRHKDSIFNYALYLLRSKEEAEDVTQETFIRLWRHPGSTAITAPKAWLFRVAHNLCVDHRRRKNLEYSTFSSLDRAAGRADRDVDPAPDPLAEVEQGELRKSLQRAVNELPAKLRSTIVLREIYGFHYQEICEILDMQMSSVKVNLHRARRTLRLRLAAIFQAGRESRDV